MVFKNRYDLERKYNHTIKDIEGYRTQAFITNSALVLFLSDRLISIYDYIIAYENDKDVMYEIDPDKKIK